MAIQLSDEMIMYDSSVVQDEPCNFISKGTFNTYSRRTYYFDSNKEFVIV
jgi:iron complex transport system ATP-binding protein